jgi:hypothetical protein
MRKLIFALVVVLLAAPAWADVVIDLKNLGNGVVQIGYNASSETELVRAFALDIVATDGNIIDINDYAVGDNNGGYGIFPGSFDDNITVNTTTGMVDSWVGNPNPYTPVAPAGDPDALGEIPGPAITIEMGSLYDDAAPPKIGVLCTITVETTCTQVCVTGNAIRGNVVLEDVSEATLDPNCISFDCFPSSFSTYLTWVALHKPACWCKPPDGSGYQCDGDADGITSPAPAKYRIFSGDLALLVANWKKKAADATLDACADIDHKASPAPAKYQVFSGDLSIVVANWKKKDTALAGNCGVRAE